ncbi:hypothetical protein PENTCL1PPCAC_9058, partial [Pristionchus entomophagus]
CLLCSLFVEIIAAEIRSHYVKPCNMDCHKIERERNACCIAHDYEGMVGGKCSGKEAYCFGKKEEEIVLGDTSQTTSPASMPVNSKTIPPQITNSTRNTITISPPIISSTDNPETTSPPVEISWTNSQWLSASILSVLFLVSCMGSLYFIKRKMLPSRPSAEAHHDSERSSFIDIEAFNRHRGAANIPRV